MAPTQQELDDAWHNFLLTAQRTPAFLKDFDIDFRREGGFAIYKADDAASTTFPTRLLDNYHAYRRNFERFRRASRRICKHWLAEGPDIAAGTQDGLSDEALVDISHGVTYPKGRFACVYALLHNDLDLLDGPSVRLIGQTTDAHAQEAAHRRTADMQVRLYPLYIPLIADSNEEETRIVGKHFLIVMCCSTLPEAGGCNLQVLDDHMPQGSNLPALREPDNKRRSATASAEEQRAEKAPRYEA